MSFKYKKNTPQKNVQKNSTPKSQPLRLLNGIVKRHPDGYGFFIPEDPELADAYIAKHNMSGVMSNDVVQVQLHRDGDRFRGEIVKIVERKTVKVTGKLKKINKTQGILHDESFAWGEDLKVMVPPQVEIKDGDWVIAKITSYPDSLRGFQGTAELVIGDLSSPLNDNIRVLASHNIPFEFTKDTLAEASRIPHEVSDEEMKGRTDLRNLNLITIDGKTAKDFDDAIYVEKRSNGFRLIVAIADVSHYVKPHSPIDKDAYMRGTSTYFPNFVAPMLPEALSNELCSLKPNVNRLSLVAEMNFDFQGEMQNTKFYEAVIRSQARVTYGEAQEVIDGNTPERLRHVANDIKNAAELSRALMEKRFENGSLNLEIPESTIEVDAAGVPVDIIRAERIFAHRLIEELMLAANVAVAKYINSKNTPCLFRVHDSPKEDAITTLNRFLDNFGYKKTIEGSTGLQKKLTRALKDFAGRPEEVVVNILTLRSMAQAKYSPDNVGHFGLGFSDYAHFTSPIRRYPDLIVHRILKACIGTSGYKRYNMEDLSNAGTILSGCEQRSVKAERQIQAIKKARMMEKFIGEEFDGIITSVAKFGVFVTLRQFDIDGLVKIEELGGDRFEFDEDNMLLVGRRSGFQYKIGDSLRIMIAAANHENGRVEFVLPGGATKDKAASTDKQSPKSKSPYERTFERSSGGRNERSNNERSGRDRRERNSNDRNDRSSINRYKEEHNLGAKKSGKDLNLYVQKSKKKSTSERSENENDSRSFRKVRVSGSIGKNKVGASRDSGKNPSRRHK
jgi:ribonuclease R